MLTGLGDVFHYRGRINWPLLILFLLINLLVLFNAVAHDPYIGYDTSAYLDYITTLAEGRLPTSEDSGEFFSPPLAFVPSAGLYAALQPYADSPALSPPESNLRIVNSLYFRLLYSIDNFPLALSAKLLQLLNVVYSVGVTLLLLKIAELLHPGHPWFKTLSLFLLGMLPVYYKTFAFVRAEPLMILLGMLGLYRLLAAYRRAFFEAADAAWLGLIAGLGMLTRQWFLAAFLTLFAGLLLLARKRGAPLLSVAAIFLLVAALVGGPFYLHLSNSEGSPLAFNRDPGAQTPWSDYFALDAEGLFSDPLRATFGLQFLPIFYSDFWGDYWGYFTFYARDRESGRYMEGLFAASDIVSPAEAADPEHPMQTNRYTINTYLGRVNALSLLPSLVLLAGFAFGLVQLLQAWRQRLTDDETNLFALLGFFAASAVLIYTTFLVLYTHEDATTVKASYLLHAAPVLAILAAEVLRRLEARNRRAFQLLMVGMGLVLLHNLPAMITRHIL